MKKNRQDYIKIALTILIIAGLFLPYVYGVLPIYFLFDVEFIPTNGTFQ